MRTNILLFISACGLLLPVPALPYADLTSDEAAVGTTRKFQGINPPTVSALTTTQALTPLYERDMARETRTDKETAIPTSTSPTVSVVLSQPHSPPMPSWPLHTRRERLTMPFAGKSEMHTEQRSSHTTKVWPFQPTPELLKRIGGS